MIIAPCEKLKISDDAVDSIASYAHKVNQSAQNIGARRLHTVLTTLLEDVMFGLPDAEGPLHFVIDAPTVRDRLARIVEDDDLRRYIL